MAYGTINADLMTTSDGVSSSGLYGFKNRIINGGMTISQRQGTSSFTPATGDYLLDRWNYQSSQASKFTVQQNAGSVTPPVGFSNYMGFTVASAVSIGSSDFFYFRQPVEGFNFSDCGWGTANASTVTLSFWVRSSLTGTFGGSILNSATSRSYPFSYSIGSANTWTQISVTIAGDTSGTWIGATNGVGVYVYFSLGMGSTYSGTAGAWASALYASTTGATSVVGTNGATFYITGVQLEKGSTATSFDYRPYGTELQLCQRYYYRRGENVTIALGAAYDSVNVYAPIAFPVSMRTTPSLGYSSVSHILGFSNSNSAAATALSITSESDLSRVELNATMSRTAGNAVFLRVGNTSGAYLNFSAEL